MRVATTILALAFLTYAPMAWSQTEAPQAPAAEAPAAPEAPAPADVPEAAEEVAVEQEAPAAAAEQVCRTIERSESRLRSRRERVCRTQAEWDALQRRSTRQGAEADNN